MNKKNKLSKWLSSFLILGLLAGLPVHAQAEEVKLDLVLGSEPPSLDPAKAGDTTSAAILNNVFEPLVIQVDGEITPGVAESWEVSEDQLTYTFKLRQDAKWNNGETVTAHDFEYAWKRFLDPATAAPNAYQVYMIKGAEAFNKGEGTVDEVAVKALDDYTLEVVLEKPTPYFIQLAASYNLSPVYQASAEEGDGWSADAGDQYVTNGAYELVSWDHNSQLIIERSEDYWDDANTVVDGATINIIESDATMNAEYQAGNLSYLGQPFGDVSLDAIDAYKAQDQLNNKPFAAIYYYTMNVEDPMMANVNLRKALALAFDRHNLVENVTKGGQIPATGYVPNSITGFEDKPDYFQDGDVEGAKEYLAKAMEELEIKDPSEITIKLSMNDSEAHAVIAQYVQQAWAENLGINTQIDSSEWQVYLDRMAAGDYQVGRLGWTGKYDDGTTFLDTYRSLEGNNYARWVDDEYTDLMKQSDEETDPDKRLEILYQAEALLMDHMPIIPVYYYANNYVVQDQYENLEPDAFGKLLLKNVRVK